MSKQSTALTLAASLDRRQIPSKADQHGAAIELRRLHELNAELLAALKDLHDETADYIKRNNLTGMDNYWMVVAREAIAKAS